ncbi:hypothetical protein Tco_1061582 [Tanacetum coccineum]
MVNTKPPYRSTLPALDDIQNGIYRRINDHKQTKDGWVPKQFNQIETNELLDHFKLWELIHRENAFVAIGNRDHVQASIALMLYCLEVEIPFNLAYFVVKRMDFYMECVDKVLPYNMILTRLFNYIVSNIERHPFDYRLTLHPRRMSSLKAKQPRKPPPKK